MAVSSLFSANTLAEQAGPFKGAEVEGGFTLTGQTTGDDKVSDEAFLSLDLVTTLLTEDGRLVVHVEGNSSQNDTGISALVGEVNGDAGSALDRDANGRFQVSEFFYGSSLGEAEYAVGLIDTAAFLDGSDVANDETVQFLNTNLVNNATIALPDYTLGLAMTNEAQAGSVGYAIVAAGSHGLGDNPNSSYSELVEMDASGKGLFVAAELHKSVESVTAKLGVWMNSAKDNRGKLNGTGFGNLYGVYGLVDLSVGDVMVNMRLGVANDEVSDAANFFSVAGNYPVGWGEIGAGIAHVGVSDNSAAGMDDSISSEIYARYELTEALQITPSLQYVENPGLDSSGTTVDAEQTIISVRVNYGF
jgi:hypothetical protein